MLQSSATPSPADVLRTLFEHRRKLIAPAVVIGLIGILYALVRPATWEASQAMIVREEAVTSPERVGKFRHPDDMKATQETILELTTSRSVLERALAEVGPPADAKHPEAWPTERDIADLQQAVRVRPPNGAEFGKTEMFYLTVKDRSRSRAIALAASLARHLQERYSELRDARARSMVVELERAVTVAEADLTESTRELGALEKEVGADLAELRILHESASSSSDLRQSLINMENELRAAETELRQTNELLSVLHAAEASPSRLLATPSRLLESQPALRRLKEGLVDAQLRTATLLGSMTDAHPRARAALEAEREVSVDLHDELQAAIRGVEADRRLNSARVASLEEQLAAARARLDRLAGMRATYSNLVAATRNRTTLVEAARRDLTEARSSQAAARATSLINLVDAPETGPNPLGPGRTVIALGGAAAGLMCGVGLVLLTSPIHPHGVAPVGPQSFPLVGPTPAACETATIRSRETIPSAGLSLRQALDRVAGRSRWN